MHLNQTQSDHVESHTIVYPGYILACIAPVVIIAMFFIGNKRLSHINTLVLTFWSSLCNCVLMICAMCIFEHSAFPTGAACITLLAGHLVANTVSHTSFTGGVLNVPPMMMAILCSLELVVGLVSQYTALKHINPGHGNALEIIGAVIVMLGNIAGPFYEMCRIRRETTDKQLPESSGCMELNGQ